MVWTHREDKILTLNHSHNCHLTEHFAALSLNSVAYSKMEIRVGSKMFADEYRKNEGNVQL